MEKCMLHKQTVPDPDLEIKGSTVIQTPRKGGGGGRSPKIFFLPFGPQFGLNIFGGPGSPGSLLPLDPLLTKHIGE